MVKKNTKGGKAHKKKKNDSSNESKSNKKADLKDEGQEYGQVTKLLGNCRLEVNCFDGLKRLCHIRGSMRKKVWIKLNDIVLISLRDFEENKADVIHKYDLDEVNYLKKEGEIPDDIKLYDDEDEPKNIGFEFIGESDEDEDDLPNSADINIDTL